MVARLERAHAPHEQLAPMGYVDAEVMGAAIAHGRSFNFIDDVACEKVDIFCVDARRAGQIKRARQVQVAPDLVLPILSPEDTVTQKLRWFDLSVRLIDSGRTFSRFYGCRLEHRVPLLRRLASGLGVAELLELALAGGSPAP